MPTLDLSTAEMRPVDPKDPVLMDWFEKAKRKYPASSFTTNEPQTWVGLYHSGRLLSAYGGGRGKDDSIVVSAAVCEPSRSGLAALALLGIMLRKMAEKHRVIFMVDSTNKRMQYIADHVLGARTIAQVKEL